MPFIAIEGPEQLIFADRRHVDTPEDYLDWYTLNLNPAARGEVTRVPVHAYISQGRWICKCICENGLFTRPEWGVAYCITCGNRYEAVIYPPDWSEIEWLLLQRPVRSQQNWLQGETVADLANENFVHGLRSAHDAAAVVR